MVLTDEQQGEIAWKLLIQKFRQRKAKDMSVKQMKDRHISLLEQEQGGFVVNPGDYRLFFRDVADTIHFELTEGSRDEDFRCTDTSYRLQIAYEVLCSEYFSEGIRVGKSFKREIHATATEANIPHEEAEAFFAQMVADLVAVAVGIELGSSTDA